MILSNVLAQLDATREDLESKQKDLKRVDKLIATLEETRKSICNEIGCLECKIIELEDELDA